MILTATTGTTQQAVNFMLAVNCEAHTSAILRRSLTAIEVLFFGIIRTTGVFSAERFLTEEAGLAAGFVHAEVFVGQRCSYAAPLGAVEQA